MEAPAPPAVRCAATGVFGHAQAFCLANQLSLDPPPKVVNLLFLTSLSLLKLSDLPVFTFVVSFDCVELMKRLFLSPV